MIHGMVEAVTSDAKILTYWLKGEEFDLQPDEERDQRIQLAAIRMLATVAMVFGVLWTIQIMTCVVTFPIRVVFKLSLAIACYAIAHDVFIMSQNANRVDFTPMKPKPYLFGLFRGEEVSEEEQARKFSHGTFLQPIWMWLYVNRNKISHHGNIDPDT